MQCKALTKSGERCKNGAQKGVHIQLCGPHYTKWQQDENSVTFVTDEKQEEKKEEPMPTRKELYYCRAEPCDVFPFTTEVERDAHEAAGEHTSPGDRGTWFKSARQALAEAEERAKEKVYLMVTGHRNTRFQPSYDSLTMLLSRAVDKYGKDKVIGICGGAKGADYIWAKVCKDMGVPFDLYLPHPDYYAACERAGFAPCSRENWTKVLNAARNVKYSATVEENGAFEWWMANMRNNDMIDKADVYIVVSGTHPNILRNQRRGGTAHAVRSIYERNITHVFFVQNETGNVSYVRLGQEVS